MNQDPIPVQFIFTEIKKQFKGFAFYATGFMVLGLMISLFSDPKYTSSAVLVKEVALGAGASSSRGSSSGGGGLGGLSSLLGGEGNKLGLMGFSLKIAATRNFILQFIKRHDLYPFLLAYDSYDAKTQTVFFDNGIFDQKNNKWLNKYNNHLIRDDEAVQAFRKILSIVRNEEDNIGIISVTYYSPKLAYEWTEKFIQDLNTHMRNEEKLKAANNITFLEEKLSAIRQDTLRLQFSFLLESEISKLMSAEVQEEFAFQIIEPPYLAINKSSGSRLFFIFSFAFLGAFVFLITKFIPSLFKPEQDSD